MAEYGVAGDELAIAGRLSVVPKMVTEYRLPAAAQTHEVAAVSDNLLVITQQSSSMLVKVALDSETGQPRTASRFLVGKSPASGLHGLFASVRYSGTVWATIQFENTIVRLDCVSQDLDSPPTELQRIRLSSRVVWGPHVVVEDGDDLWITYKGSNHVVRVNHIHPPDYSTYQCSRRPIFVAIHPTSRDVYASLDQSSKIFRLVRSKNTTSEIDLPADKGTLPVGLVAAPDGNVWFVMLGGSGTFGRISSSGDITWFTLTSTAGATAGLIHLAFDRRYGNSTRVCCYLLSSSLNSVSSPNAVIRVFIDGNPSKIVSEVAILVPTPDSMTHRVLPHRGGLFLTEMMASLLAHVRGSALSERKSETTDEYNLWGWGASNDSVHYRPAEDAWLKSLELGDS